MQEERIYWVDATHAEAACKSRALKLRPVLQISRGLVINEGEDFVTIVCTNSPEQDEDEDEHYRDILSIPKEMIKDRKPLKEA